MRSSGTIFVEDAEILAQQAYGSDQFVLRVRAPNIAAGAHPGSFTHICCHPSLPMRRPLSIMRANADSGELQFLYKIVGQGTRLLAQRRPGETINIVGPIGRSFILHQQRPRTLLLGGGVGIPPIVFLAERLGVEKSGYIPCVMMGSEIPFPFTPRSSRIMVSGIPEEVIAAMPLMEDWGIPSRLASSQVYPGYFLGHVTDLARVWLAALGDDQRQQVEIFACGPHPMLRAAALLAADYNLPCQVCLEEFMACGVGGCAGCVVEVKTATGSAMKRVCVDGPVFDAASVFA